MRAALTDRSPRRSFALLVGMLAGVPAALACDPAPGVVPAASWGAMPGHYEAVFLARTVAPLRAGTGQAWSVRAEVLRTWKGRLPRAVVLASSGSSCSQGALPDTGVWLIGTHAGSDTLYLSYPDVVWGLDPSQVASVLDTLGAGHVPGAASAPASPPGQSPQPGTGVPDSDTSTRLAPTSEARVAPRWAVMTALGLGALALGGLGLRSARRREGFENGDPG